MTHVPERSTNSLATMLDLGRPSFLAPPSSETNLLVSTGAVATAPTYGGFKCDIWIPALKRD